VSDTGSFSSIADSSKPNAGRIYDYALGGNHNFEVDRLAAQQIMTIAPFFPKLVRIIRWFLGEAVRRLVADGYTQFVDFASGLPTVDHIHQVAPAGTKVIYSDIDPVTVAYGQEILKDNPNARYLLCDVGRPEDLLAAPVVTEMLGTSRRVAIGLNGIAFFLSNERLGHALKVLYDWAAKGSRLFICDSGFEGSATMSEPQQIMKIYEKLGQPVTLRSLATLKQLLQPWTVREPGFLKLEEWVGMKASVAEEMEKGGGMSFKGAILEK
jgi:hypothetical protein